MARRAPRNVPGGRYRMPSPGAPATVDAVIEWTDEQQMVRAAVRDFIEKELVPQHRELEHGDLLPYDIIRRLFATFGLDAMARERFERQMAGADSGSEPDDAERDPRATASAAALQIIPIIELSRWSPGMVTAMGVSMGLTAAAILSRGTAAQKERWALPLLTMEKIDEGNPPAERKVVSFVLDSGMPGLEQSAPLRKMGMHSSPTGELFLTDVRVGRDRLIGEAEDAEGGGRTAAKATFLEERSGVAAMALGIISQCLDLCVAYARDRVQFGQPIGEFQLIQDKLARMEVARLNVENLVFRVIEASAAGRGFTLAEASAMKLYAARAATEVAMEAVQLFGGNGYMAEFQVEQLARDAKVLQIYGGTDEIQITHIAKDLLRR